MKIDFRLKIENKKNDNDTKGEKILIIAMLNIILLLTITILYLNKNIDNVENKSEISKVSLNYEVQVNNN